MKPVSGVQMCQALESRGWVLVRVCGIHHVYRHPTSGQQATVPVRRNKQLKPGTQRRLAREAGPAVNEL